VVGNEATNSGGGTYASRNYNNTIVGNHASSGGGIGYGYSVNCIIYYNQAAAAPNSLGELSHCCTTPLALGTRNIAAPPDFVDLVGGDLRLRYGSLCIDAGTNLSDLIAVDFYRNSRPVDGVGDGVSRFDIGAHEYDRVTADSNTDGIPDGWCLEYGLNPIDPGLASGNPDNDPHTTYQEWVADTDPTDGQSFFRIDAIEAGEWVRVGCLTSSNRVYTLFASDRAAPLPNDADDPWSPVPGQEDVIGTGEWLWLQDVAPATQGYYQIEVRVPDGATRSPFLVEDPSTIRGGLESRLQNLFKQLR